MLSTAKSIKSVAKEAKFRLKTRFWQEYKEEVDSGVEKAKEEGLNISKVAMYYQSKITKNIRGEKAEDELFYSKVKGMLKASGLPANALDLLMDKTYFESLDYYAKENYLFRLSEKYLKAIERYNKEKLFECLT